MKVLDIKNKRIWLNRFVRNTHHASDSTSDLFVDIVSNIQTHIIYQRLHTIGIQIKTHTNGHEIKKGKRK